MDNSSDEFIYGLQSCAGQSAILGPCWTRSLGFISSCSVFSAFCVPSADPSSRPAAISWSFISLGVVLPKYSAQFSHRQNHFVYLLLSSTNAHLIISFGIKLYYIDFIDSKAELIFMLTYLPEQDQALSRQRFCINIIYKTNFGHRLHRFRIVPVLDVARPIILPSTASIKLR